jgi:haloalkane dehalogenase
MRASSVWKQTILASALALGIVACGPEQSADPTPASGTTAKQSEMHASTVVPWEGYPFVPRFVEINGSQLHYIDEGQEEGQVYLFLHGNPTSSYLWRNVVPIVAESGRAIAVDNIGFGRSDKPDIDYTFIDHSEYIEGFINKLDLKNIILVIHDWGSALGFDYARRHPDHVKGIVFMEAILGGGSLSDLPEPMKSFFTGLRTPGIGEEMVIEQNVFIEQGLFAGMKRHLSEGEKDAYRQPFLDKESRYPILVWPRQIPFDGEPADTAARINTYMAWLPTSDLPKLHLYVTPGTADTPALAASLDAQWSSIESQFLGEGFHFLQEDHAEAIGHAIVEWSSRQFDPE